MNILETPDPNITPIRKSYLSNYHPKLSQEILSKSTKNISPFFTASQLASIYGIPAPNTSISNVIGVMSFGGGIYGDIDSKGFLTNGDVHKTWAYEGIPADKMPKVIVCLIGGARNNLNYKGGTDENTLDVSIIGSCCPSPNLTIILFIFTQAYFFSQCFEIMIAGITIDSIKYTPSIISVSWGASEIQYLYYGIDYTRDLTNLNNVLEPATRNGLNVCVASGDWGSTNNNGTRQLTVDYPSSCPYLTAVGGTTLTCPNGIYDAATIETVWNDGVKNGTFYGTGGGVSAFYNKPTYQAAISGTKRSVPDIALNSDPDTGIVLYINNVLRVIGGTSMAAPMFAGYLSAINAKRFVNPLLYSANYVSCFHDIISGTNYDTNSNTAIKSYTADLNYDNCTGLGSIIGDALALVLVPVEPMTTPTQTPTIISFELKSGWNLIGTSVNTLPLPSNSNITSIFQYTNNNFSTISTTSALTANNGYWIFVTGADNITLNLTGVIPTTISIILTPGWNLIGTSIDTLPLPSNDNITSIFQYTNNNFSTISTTSSLTANNGYWIFVTGMDNITINLR